jgi:hypothetical protein
MIVRLAENSDGETVRALLMAGGNPFDATIPFDDIHPYWIVVELPGRGIVGCIQTCPSRPIGRLEMLAVADDLDVKERACVVRELLAQGVACLYMHRAAVVAGFIPFALKSYKRFLKRRGGVVADSGNMIMWREPVAHHLYKDKGGNSAVPAKKENGHAVSAHHSG